MATASAVPHVADNEGNTFISLSSAVKISKTAENDGYASLAIGAAYPSSSGPRDNLFSVLL